MFNLSPVLDWFFGKIPTLDDVIGTIEAEFAKIRKEGAQHRNIDVRNAKFCEKLYPMYCKIPPKFAPDVADLVWARLQSLFPGFYNLAVSQWNRFVETSRVSGYTSLKRKKYKDIEDFL